MAIIEFEKWPIEFKRRKMRTIRLRFRPADGTLHLSVPHNLTQGEIERFLNERRDWIEQQLPDGASRHLQLIAAHFESGESVLYFGEALKVRRLPAADKGTRLVKIDIIAARGELSIQAAESASSDQITRAWQRILRSELESKAQPLITKWQRRTGAEIKELRIRSMKSRWGSCHITARRVTLALELAGRPVEALEYVILHEILHLFEPGHNQHFYQLLDRYMPDWQERRKLLQRLAHPL